MRGLAWLVGIAVLAGCTNAPQAMPTEPDGAGAVATVVASTTEPAPTIEPTPTSAPATPAPTPITYATLTSRGWGLLLKSPDAYVGKGYKLWACIAEFDSLTGPAAFLAQASYQKEFYWYIRGTRVEFVGTAKTLAPFIKGDVVAMSVVDLGVSSGYPAFRVDKITRTGDCSRYL